MAPFPHDYKVVPAWNMSITRSSPGAELWRIADDGQQEILAVYGARRVDVDA